MTLDGWVHVPRHWRWAYRDEAGRVLYWISDQAVGSEYDNPDGFVAQTGERVPPLPQEAQQLARTMGVI
jgi:hypothetical protein